MNSILKQYCLYVSTTATQYPFLLMVGEALNSDPDRKFRWSQHSKLCGTCYASSRFDRRYNVIEVGKRPKGTKENAKEMCCHGFPRIEYTSARIRIVSLSTLMPVIWLSSTEWYYSYYDYNDRLGITTNHALESRMAQGITRPVVTRQFHGQKFPDTKRWDLLHSLT